jgi:hypothetical protein
MTTIISFSPLYTTAFQHMRKAENNNITEWNKLHSFIVPNSGFWKSGRKLMLGNASRQIEIVIGN